MVLATDGDREGEGIAWHLQQQLKLRNPKRAVYNQITPAAFKAAIAKVLSPSSLNPQSAKDLEWLASDDGKLARNILDWNKDNLKACQQNQQNLKEALIVMNGKYVTKGLCALWVLPDDQRVYEDRR